MFLKFLVISRDDNIFKKNTTILKLGDMFQYVYYITFKLKLQTSD